MLQVTVDTCRGSRIHSQEYLQSLSTISNDAAKHWDHLTHIYIYIHALGHTCTLYKYFEVDRLLYEINSDY